MEELTKEELRKILDEAKTIQTQIRRNATLAESKLSNINSFDDIVNKLKEKIENSETGTDALFQKISSLKQQTEEIKNNSQTKLDEINNQANSVSEKVKEIEEFYTNEFVDLKDKVQDEESGLGKVWELANSLKQQTEEIKNNSQTKLDEINNQANSVSEKVKEIEEFYTNEFVDLKDKVQDEESGLGKVWELANSLKQQTEEIKNNSQTKLDEINNQANSVSEKVKEIEEFYKKLLNQENGIEVEINKIYNTIIQKHSDLFNSEEGKKGKVEKLEENIANIKTFNKSLEEDIKVNLDEKQKYLDDVKKDIETKRKDVKSLLSNATLGALTQGYEESKEEYSKVKSIKLKDKNGNKVHSVFETHLNNIGRHIPNLMNYCLFIIPLLLASLIFTGINFEDIINKNSGSWLEMINFEFSFSKFLFSFPLFWVSWFGQRNISQRKRLFEEYNHKLRVVQIYRMFSDNDESYNINNTEELENILLEVIKKNPAEQLGKSETMIDQILEKFRIKGFYNELKEEVRKEVVEELKPIIKIASKDDSKTFVDTEKS